MPDYPVAENLYRQLADKAVVLGCRCRACGETFFPADLTSCSACSGGEMERITLGSEGRLWTWTIQNFMPKSPYRSDLGPEQFRPYGVGYVEFPAGVMVEGRVAATLPVAHRDDLSRKH